MNWKFWARERMQENRAEITTDYLLGQIVRHAANSTAKAGAEAALEAASGLWARSLAAAKVTPRTPATNALTPRTLGLIGRFLVRRGELALQIRVSRLGRVELLPAASWYIDGGVSEDDWRYRLDLFGASRTETVLLPAASVLHPRYSVDPAQPWQGLGPLDWADRTGGLLASTERLLAGEASKPSGYLLGVDESTSRLAKTIEDFTRAMTTALQQADGGAMALPSPGDQGSMNVRNLIGRVGMDTPPEVREVWTAAGAMALAACGVPAALFDPTQGTSVRESYRLFLATTLQPVADALAEHAADRLDAPGLRLDLSGLLGIDTRARVFGGLTGAGMESSQAAALAGLAA